MESQRVPRPSHLWRIATLGLALLVLIAVGGRNTSAIAWSQTESPRAPKAGCLPGETPAQRIDAAIAILIGFTEPPANATSEDYRLDCPAAAILPYYDPATISQLLGRSPSDVWDAFLAGASLTLIAAEEGVDRGTLISHLQGAYTAAADALIASGALTERRRQTILAEVLPQFVWLVDWRHNDPLAVPGGDVDRDSAAELIAACAPGGGLQEQIANVVRLILGLDVDGLPSADALAAEGCSSLSVIAQTDFTSLLVTVVVFSVQEYFQQYLDGQSLLDIYQNQAGAGSLDALYQDLMDRIAQTVAAEVDAGRISAADRERIEQEAFLIVVTTLKHHPDDLLPTQFMETTSIDESAGAAASAAPTCHGRTATIWATTSGAYLIGTSGNDVIVGSSSADSIFGEGGDDLICGEGGNDYLNGNQGRDEIYGGNGDDEICGELCYVAIIGNDDTLHGGNGDDDLYGQIGDDTLYGDHGDDNLYGSDGADDLYGGDHDDLLDGGTGVDYCTGGSGNDTLSQC